MCVCVCVCVWECVKYCFCLLLFFVAVVFVPKSFVHCIQIFTSSQLALLFRLSSFSFSSSSSSSSFDCLILVHFSSWELDARFVM